MNAKILFCWLIFFSMGTYADKIDCLDNLRDHYNFHQGWFVGNIFFSFIPLVGFYTIPNSGFNKNTANNFLRAKRIVEQAHFKYTDEFNSPELMKLIINIKKKNSNIKKKQVKTIIKLMAQEMTGICQPNKGDYSQFIKRFYKKNLINMTYKITLEKFNVPEPRIDDSEETINLNVFDHTSL